MIRAAIGAAAKAAAAAAVAGDAPAGEAIPETLTITGITDPADSDPLVLTRTTDYSGYARWGDAPDWSVYWDLGSWFIERADYLASKSDEQATPIGLTGWTVSTGTGQPTVAGA